MPKNLSKDFRYVYTNAYGVRLSDNDVTIRFGIHDGGDPEDMLQEVAIIMTPRTLKIMLNGLNNALKGIEAELGEIPVPPEKLASSFDEMVESGRAIVEKPEKSQDQRTILEALGYSENEIELMTPDEALEILRLNKKASS